MYNGWFCFGGNEIVNNTRAVDYAQSADCPVNWFTNGRCEGLTDYLQEPPYNFSDIESAPWYDPDVPFLSREFLGVYALAVDGLDDETITAPVTERVLSGGIVGRQRDGSRAVRFRVVLTATTADGREYGRAWLASLLRESTCGMHAGGSCGTADLSFMVSCPLPFNEAGEGSLGDYLRTEDVKRRILHGVKCTTGLIKEQEWNRPGAFGAVYEFTLTGEEPRLLGLPQEVWLQNIGQTVVQDIPFNLHPTPSAELSSGTSLIAENLSTNPSVETNTTGWSQSSTAITGSSPAGFITSVRTTDLHADDGGIASFQVRLLGSGAAAGGRSTVRALQSITGLNARPANSRYSVNIWGALLVLGGVGVTTLHELSAYVTWLNGAVELRSDPLGNVTVPSDMDGHVFSAKGILPPPGTTQATVVIQGDFTWASGGTNSDVRLYADALAFTAP